MNTGLDVLFFFKFYQFYIKVYAKTYQKDELHNSSFVNIQSMSDDIAVYLCMYALYIYVYN